MTDAKLMEFATPRDKEYLHAIDQHGSMRGKGWQL